LGIDVEVQQKRHSGVFGSLHEYDSLSITLVACLFCGNGCRLFRSTCWICRWSIQTGSSFDSVRQRAEQRIRILEAGRLKKAEWRQTIH
jgi:hypothetical protein